MEQTNRKYIAIIAFLRKFISVFFNLFFNIYILQIVDNDLNFIIKYSLFGVIVGIGLEYLLLKIIHSKNVKIIYRASFPLLVGCILLLIVFKEKIVNYIYLFKFLERMATLFYSVPYELAIIGSNTNETMSSYMANLNILENISAILTPIFSGFIIERFSYNLFFVLLSLEAILIILVSFSIKDFTISDKKLELRKFWKLAKDKKHIQDIYQCMFYRRISAQGAMVELLPIVLFLRLGTELDFGMYQSLFAIVAILSLQILKMMNRKKIEKKFYPYFAGIIFMASVVMVYNTSFISLLVYYLLMNSLGSIIESEACSSVYAAIRIGDLEQYKKEHIMMFNIYMTVGQLMSYDLVYVLYHYFYQVNILSIVISVLMFFLIIASIYLRKTEKFMFKIKEENS